MFLEMSSQDLEAKRTAKCGGVSICPISLSSVTEDFRDSFPQKNCLKGFVQEWRWVPNVLPHKNTDFKGGWNILPAFKHANVEPIAICHAILDSVGDIPVVHETN